MNTQNPDDKRDRNGSFRFRQPMKMLRCGRSAGQVAQRAGRVARATLLEWGNAQFAVNELRLSGIKHAFLLKPLGPKWRLMNEKRAIMH